MAGEVIPPPYVITADDKRGLIVVTGAAVLAFVWSCFLIRVWLRWQSREWRSDDWWLTAATLLDTVQSGIIFHLVELGLGASQAGVPISQLQQLGNPPEQKAEQLGTPRLTLATGRFRVANHLYLCDTRLEAIGAVPVPTTIAWWSASHRIMVTRSLVLCMGTGVGHIGCHTM
ncbi:hypothetical protein IG631_06025 [Alternaria alternata]|nr:hypothetical protein IG631_06025 [Alternaria alternata]